MRKTENLLGISGMRVVFAQHLLVGCTPEEACRRAGYSTKGRRSLAMKAWQLQRDPGVLAVLPVVARAIGLPVPVIALPPRRRAAPSIRKARIRSMADAGAEVRAERRRRAIAIEHRRRLAGLLDVVPVA